MNRNLPDLKRFWYCERKHASTTGCVCKKHPNAVPRCQSIIDTLLQHIDEIRARDRLPRARSYLGDTRHVRMIRTMIYADFSQTERRMMVADVYRYGLPQMIMHDELTMYKPKPQPAETEGRPSKPKAWHKFIELNHRKKPR